MNLTRQQLINHCLDAIHAGKYLLVRVDGYPVGLNPRFAKQVQLRSDLSKGNNRAIYHSAMRHR